MDKKKLTEKDFRFIGKKELVNMLLSANEETEQLKKEVENLKNEISEKNAELDEYKKASASKNGSMIEVQKEIGKLFTSAQLTADNYVKNAKLSAEEKLYSCQRVLDATMKKCMDLEHEVQDRCEEIFQTFKENFSLHDSFDRAGNKTSDASEEIESD